MEFKTISLIKHRTEKVWSTMRDELPKLAEMMDDIESITEKERIQSKTLYQIVNIWKSATRLPQPVMNLLHTDSFSWTDRAEWNNESHICQWSIEMHYFHDAVQCHGSTVFEPAMGGNGTKVTFSGNLILNSRKLEGFTGVLGEAVFAAAQGIIQNTIQKNFRKVTETIGKHLDKNSQTGN
jgi:hypothetical protein